MGATGPRARARWFGRRPPIQWAAKAAELATEFRAPVGILDPRLRRWCSVVGAPESQFPEIDEALVRACRSGELIQGCALSWRRPLDRKRVWLLLRVSDGLVAVVGFQAPDESQPGTAEWDESSAKNAGSPV